MGKLKKQTACSQIIMRTQICKCMHTCASMLKLTVFRCFGVVKFQLLPRFQLCQRGLWRLEWPAQACWKASTSFLHCLSVLFVLWSVRPFPSLSLSLSSLLSLSYSPLVSLYLSLLINGLSLSIMLTLRFDLSPFVSVSTSLSLSLSLSLGSVSRFHSHSCLCQCTHPCPCLCV